jgi:hypothetical protein
VDLDRTLRHVVVSTRRHPVFLCPFFYSCDQPGSLSVQARYTQIFDPTLDTFVCGLVLFLIRFHLMPWALSYTVMGMLSFPLETEFVSALNYFVGLLVN